MADTTTNPTAATERAAKGASVMTVACKLPNGLQADLMGADGTLKRRVLFRGSAAQRRIERGDDNGRLIESEPVSSVVAGFGLTEVDADFWEAWIAQNKTYEPVKSGLIFAYAKPLDARRKATEGAALRHGFEPLNPEKPATGIKPDARHTGKPDEIDQQAAAA